MKQYIKGIEADAYTGDLLTVRKYGESTLLFKGRKAVIDSSNPAFNQCEFVEIPMEEIRNIDYQREYGQYTIGRLQENVYHLLFGGRLLLEADAQKLADYVNECA